MAVKAVKLLKSSSELISSKVSSDGGLTYGADEGTILKGTLINYDWLIRAMGQRRYDYFKSLGYFEEQP